MFKYLYSVEITNPTHIYLDILTYIDNEDNLYTFRVLVDVFTPAQAGEEISFKIDKNFEYETYKINENKIIEILYD